LLFFGAKHQKITKTRLPIHPAEQLQILFYWKSCFAPVSLADDDMVDIAKRAFDVVELHKIVPNLRQQVSDILHLRPASFFW